MIGIHRSWRRWRWRRRGGQRRERDGFDPYLIPDNGDVPTNAQALALGRFLRGHFRSDDPRCRGAHVSRGGTGLGDDHLYVRFNDGYEGGIDREGRTST